MWNFLFTVKNNFLEPQNQEKLKYPEIYLFLKKNSHNVLNFFLKTETCNFIKKEALAHLNFAKFLRTPFLTEHLPWLLLKFI